MPATPILSPVPPLRIAVLGAGKIGSAFAFHLARTGGHDVTVVARPDSVRLQQLERDRAIVDVKGARADVRVASRLDEAVPYDLVIVTLLAHQADALLPALRSSAAEGIQFMFNTFDPERLREALGDDRCSFGMPFVQATLTADGRLDAKVGAAGQRTIMGRQRWVDLFNAAGLPAALERDMPSWLRCHAPLCVAFESVSIAGERRGSGASWKQALTLAHGLRASFALSRRSGTRSTRRRRGASNAVRHGRWRLCSGRCRAFDPSGGCWRRAKPNAVAWSRLWRRRRRSRGRRSTSRLFGLWCQRNERGRGARPLLLHHGAERARQRHTPGRHERLL